VVTTGIGCVAVATIDVGGAEVAEGASVSIVIGSDVVVTDESGVGSVVKVSVSIVVFGIGDVTGKSVKGSALGIEAVSEPMVVSFEVFVVLASAGTGCVTGAIIAESVFEVLLSVVAEGIGLAGLDVADVSVGVGLAVFAVVLVSVVGAGIGLAGLAVAAGSVFVGGCSVTGKVTLVFVVSVVDGVGVMFSLTVEVTSGVALSSTVFVGMILSAEPELVSNLFVNSVTSSGAMGVTLAALSAVVGEVGLSVVAG
jgi:hypothetical protein